MSLRLCRISPHSSSGQLCWKSKIIISTKKGLWCFLFVYCLQLASSFWSSMPFSRAAHCRPALLANSMDADLFSLRGKNGSRCIRLEPFRTGRVKFSAAWILLSVAQCLPRCNDWPASRLLRVASARRLLLITAAALIKNSCA